MIKTVIFKRDVISVINGVEKLITPKVKCRDLNPEMRIEIAGPTTAVRIENQIIFSKHR